MSKTSYNPETKTWDRTYDDPKYGTLTDHFPAGAQGAAGSPPPEPSPSPVSRGLAKYRAGGDVGLGVSPNSKAAAQAAAPPAGPAAAQVPEIPAGAVATRQGTRERGISDDRIGWNDKTASVTLDGNDVFKPDTVIDGTSYADNEALNRIAEQAYSNKNDPLKAARDYVIASGVPSGAVDWDGANVIIGGRAIKPAFVRDGVAYIPTSQLDAAVAAYRSNSGLRSSGEVYDDNKHYRNRLEGMLNDLLSRREFVYDPENDKAFTMYRDLGERLADDAYRRVLENNSSSFQNASGAVQGMALGARNNMLERLAGSVGDYYDRAYDRYNDDYSKQRQGFSDASTLFNNFYDQQYRAGRDSVSDLQSAQANERQIKQQDFQNDLTLQQLALQYITHALQSRGLDIANQGSILDNEGRTIQNDQARENLRSSTLQNLLTEAYNRGAFTPEAAALWQLTGRLQKGADGLMENFDGTPYRPWSPELDYLAEQVANQAYGQASGQLKAQKEYGVLQ